MAEHIPLLGPGLSLWSRALPALFRWSSWKKLALIVQLISLEFRWYPVWICAILDSMRLQVYREIHAWCRCSRWCCLAMAS